MCFAGKQISGYVSAALLETKLAKPCMAGSGRTGSGPALDRHAAAAFSSPWHPHASPAGPGPAAPPVPVALSLACHAHPMGVADALHGHLRHLQPPHAG